MARKEGRLEGYELRIQQGKEDEQRKWLTEGHGDGLCLSMAAHVRELFRGAVLLEEAETQTDKIATANIDIQTTLAPTTAIDVDTQTIATAVDASTQVAPGTDETAVQTCDDPHPAPQTPVIYHDIPPSIATSPSATATMPEPNSQKMMTWATSSTQMDTVAIMIVTTAPTINIETQTTNISPVVIDASTQTTHCPRQKETATHAEPLDDNHPHLSEGIKISTKPQVSPTIVMDPQPEPQVSRSALLHDELVEP